VAREVLTCVSVRESDGTDLTIYSFTYCDMTPERWKCEVRQASQRRPLLVNGSLKQVSAATDKLVEARALLRN
jgi:hypothetical protein